MQIKTASQRLTQTTSHKICHPIFQQLGAITKCDNKPRLNPQNDVASTNPNDDVLYPLQELSADRYKSAVASQNVTVSKSYSALLLKSTKVYVILTTLNNNAYVDISVISRYKTHNDIVSHPIQNTLIQPATDSYTLD
ncbi:hypothetical protein F511_17689 [Dorcoceras hygrometricum]|uniref:Uncharacterized protein n=1 Tax=Dorcoceras hygrometricum TaxID=472368 RepID=A0A2Z6ZYJ8_9LAMI|nr:hypothetical protein F511_17689 [Dorcoceras hygrometricum]